MNREEGAAIARAAKAAKAPSLHDRFWSKVNIKSDVECWNWTASLRRKDEGYGAFWMNGKHHPASKVAWLLTNGEISFGLVVCHKCDNPSCCNPHHLFAATQLDNNKDKVSKNRQAKGSKSPRSVLSEQIVKKLRSMAEIMSISEAARQLGINRSTAWDAVKRGWRHV